MSELIKSVNIYETRYKRKYAEDNEHLIHALFSKRYKLPSVEQPLPDPLCLFSSEPWADDKLQEFKTKLNHTKSQLNDLDLEEWSAHTRRRNPAGEVSWRLRQVVNPEFLTQAWTKFYECAHIYKIVPAQALEEKKLVSLHLCEAPGAFIAALNHYLVLNHEDIEKWEWRASTLNPYYEGNSPSTMIDDDRFMFHTLDNWDFGVDETGNLMNWENSQSIIKNTQRLGKILLVTADGSIDCVERPDEQEGVTSPLHYCEIVTALQALSEGGTFIFKLFTMFEHNTVSALYFVHHFFEEVNICKPITSKQGNSEVYAVCLRFKGPQKLEPYIPYLRSAFGTELFKERAFLPKASIPQEFLGQIRTFAKSISEIQCNVINNNLETFMGYYKAYYTDVKRIKEEVSKAFIARYGLKSIPEEKEILKGELNVDKRSTNMNQKYNRGSFTQRISYDLLSSKDKLQQLITIFNCDIKNLQHLLTNDAKSLELYNSGPSAATGIIYGAPVVQLCSSKFLYSPIYKLFLKIVAVEDFKEIIFGKVLIEREVKLTKGKDGNHMLVFPDYDYEENYETFEKRTFSEFYHKLKDLKLHDSVCLLNMNLLTHFNVSVLNVLAVKCFGRITFTAGPKVMLEDFLKAGRMVHMNKIYNEVSKCNKRNNKAGKTVLSALPIKVTNTGELYDCIVSYNKALYYKKCDDCLSCLVQSLD